MHGQDQRAVFGENEIIGRNFDAFSADAFDLLEQCPWVDDDAIADDGQFARAHDAGGQKAQLIGNPVDDKGMAGVMAALKPHHDVGAI